jgi:hypothetical protein
VDCGLLRQLVAPLQRFSTHFWPLFYLGRGLAASRPGRTLFPKLREDPRFTNRNLNIVIGKQEVTAMRDIRSLVDAILYILGGIVGIGILVTTLLS